MELTIDQALRQGIAAHKEGKLQDAERLYRAILQGQPKHPDANHNLGVLAVSVGKPLDALPLFKLAVDSNPKTEQFWLSYIDVLIKVRRFEDAKKALADGIDAGIPEDKLKVFYQTLQGSVPKSAGKTAKMKVLSGKKKKLAERQKNKKRKVRGSSSSAEPSHDQISCLAEHYEAGRLEEAEAFAALLTKQFPKHPFGWKVLGAVYKQMGRKAESLAPMQLAVKLSLQDAEAHSNLGVTFKDLGRLYEAEASLKQAILLKPSYAEAHSNLGVTLKELGRLDEAEASFRNALVSKPGFAEAHSNLGVLLRELSRLGEAEASLRQAILMKPDYAEAHSNLGATLKEIGKLDEAEASLRHAISLEPSSAKAWCNLGNTLQDQGRLEEAEASLRHAIELNPSLAEAHYNLGNTLKELGRFDAVEASYRQAIALKPDFAKAISNLGFTLQELGSLEEARESYIRAIAVKPDYAKAHRNLTAIKKFSSQDEQFLQMQAIHRDFTISEDNRCNICFALAKASEDLEDLAAAFQFYVEGNTLRKKQLGYDKKKDVKLFEKLKANYSRISAHRLKPEINVPEHVPIFILGMPRSGTTLVEQIISSHWRVTGAGELPFVSYFGESLAVGQTPVDGEALKTFREQYLNALQRRSEGNIIVADKMPHNFRFLGLIAAALPEAKIIHVKRDPAAVCWGNYTQYFGGDSLGYCYDLNDILHYHDLYQDLMAYWHQALPNRIYDLSYEAVTERQEEETRKLIAHLELAWDETCLSPQDNKRGVATASNVQVRKQVYQGSSERWKRYRPYLNGALDNFSRDNK